MTTNIVINCCYSSFRLSKFGEDEYLNKGGNKDYLPYFDNKNSRLCPILIKLIYEYSSKIISGSRSLLYIDEIENDVLKYPDCWHIEEYEGNENIQIDYEKIKLHKQIYKLTIENIIHHIIKKNNTSYLNMLYMLDENILEMIFNYIDIEHLNMLKLSIE